MTYFEGIAGLWLLASLAGCNVREVTSSEPFQLDQKKQIVTPIKAQTIAGLVRSVEFNMEQALIQGDTLTLRQGKDFFADLSVEVVTFDPDGFATKTFTHAGSTQQTHPFLRLSKRSDGDSLPDTIIVASEYELYLKFEQATALGIPFSIRLSSLEHGTSIEGRATATFDDIKLTNNGIDLTFDSFDTLKHVARQYIEGNHKGIILGESFGATYVSSGTAHPQSGFIGFEATTDSGEQTLLKIQLKKDENGWSVAKQLQPNQIPQAHPVFITTEGSARTVENGRADHAAAQQLETYLNESNIIGKVRSTSASCYLSEARHRASCRVSFNLKHADNTECRSKNYLLSNNDNAWIYESEILEHQQVDYRTGELVTVGQHLSGCQ